jgi:hypothetical protein
MPGICAWGIAWLPSGLPGGHFALVAGAALAAAVAELNDGHDMQSAVDLPVAHAGEPVADLIPGGCAGRGGTVPGREVRLGREPGDVTGHAEKLEAGAAHKARPHPHMLRHTFVTTMLDAGVDLRDVQIAARHADPRTTMRYDRARKNPGRHPNYILAAYMAAGT